MGMFKDIMENRVKVEAVESEETWRYEITEAPITVEEVTEHKVKATRSALSGATLNTGNRRKKMQEAKLGNKKRRRKRVLDYY